MMVVTIVVFLGVLLAATIILATTPDPNSETGFWDDVKPENREEVKWRWNEKGIEIKDDETGAKTDLNDIFQKIQDNKKRGGKKNKARSKGKSVSTTSKKRKVKLPHVNTKAKDVQGKADQPQQCKMSTTSRPIGIEKGKPSTNYLQQCQCLEQEQNGQITKLDYFKNQIVSFC